MDEDEERLSRQLRDELESLFEQARASLFDWDGAFDDEMQTLEERFILLVSRYPEEALRKAVLMTAEDTPETSYSGRLPIHLACDNNAPIGCDVEKRTICVKDENGSLPLHMACRYNAGANVIRLLLESDVDKESLYAEGVYGQLPLHVACRGGASAEVIQVLLDFDSRKISVLKEDSVGRLAIHLYLLDNRNRDRNMQIVRLLLEAMICNRIAQVGLELWKITMNQLLVSLTKSYERDFVTRERLDSICAQIKELLHRAFLLELAIWKGSCLRGLNSAGINFHCLQDIDNWEKVDSKFDASQYRQEMLHLGGADQIIPHVLPFVEDEAIVKLMDELN